MTTCINVEDAISVSSLSVITKVCIPWRAIALSTMPKLWSRIFIFSSHPRHLVMSKLFLERSKSHPLILTVQYNNPGELTWHSVLATHPEEHNLTESIIYLLITHLHRWKNVTFSARKQPSLLSLNLTAEAAPLLQKVTCYPGMQTASITFVASSHVRRFVSSTGRLRFLL